MKTKNIFKFITVLFIAVSFSSCVEDGDYTIPTLGADANYANLKSLSEIVDLYNGDLINFDEYIQAASISEITTYGYVVSNDRAGNFFKTLIIQDKPENPTIGIEVRIDDTNLNARYNVGRKIYIKLSGPDQELNGGLAFTKRFDTYQIGVKNIAGNGIDRIGVNDYINFIDRSSEIATLIPTTVDISNITDAHINTLVKLDNMQTLNKDEIFANPDDTFSVNRLLKNCATEETVIMRTSGFASFKGLPIPQKRGSVTALLNKFRTDYQLFVRDLNDFDFTQDRCDPLFEENFQSATDNTDLDIVGWKNIAEVGGEKWTEQEFRSNGYAEFSGFRTNDDSNIGWLISPSIDMDAQEGEVLTFKAAQHHVTDSDNNTLEVLVSTDFDGTNVASATWTTLIANLPNSNTTWYQFQDSGQIDLSSYTGNLYIAFKSVASGTNSNLDGSYMVDDVKVSFN